MKGLHDNHRQRMRERYGKEGLANFQPHEVMELLLYEAIPRVNTNPIGHRLVNRFGSTAGIFEASEEELCTVQGVGKASARLIHKVRDHMLGTILRESDFVIGNDALCIAAEYHMRILSDGVVSVLSRDVVFDYTSEDGDWTGLSASIAETMSERGITEYAVVVRRDDFTLPDALVEEFGRGTFPCVWMLSGGRMTKITDYAAWKTTLEEFARRTDRVVMPRRSKKR